MRIETKYNIDDSVHVIRYIKNYKEYICPICQRHASEDTRTLHWALTQREQQIIDIDIHIEDNKAPKIKYTAYSSHEDASSFLEKCAFETSREAQAECDRLNGAQK